MQWLTTPCTGQDVPRPCRRTLGSTSGRSDTITGLGKGGEEGKGEDGEEEVDVGEKIGHPEASALRVPRERSGEGTSADFS